MRASSLTSFLLWISGENRRTQAPQLASQLGGRGPGISRELRGMVNECAVSGNVSDRRRIHDRERRSVEDFHHLLSATGGIVISSSNCRDFGVALFPTFWRSVVASDETECSGELIGVHQLLGRCPRPCPRHEITAIRVLPRSETIAQVSQRAFCRFPDCAPLTGN